MIDPYHDCEWSKLILAKGDMLILGCMYRRPHCTVENIIKLYDVLTGVCASNHAHFLILGDLNFREINWNPFNCNVNESKQYAKIRD